MITKHRIRQNNLVDYYKDYHLIRERAGKGIGHHDIEQRIALNLKMGKIECEQNHVLSEKKSK